MTSSISSDMSAKTTTTVPSSSNNVDDFDSHTAFTRDVPGPIVSPRRKSQAYKMVVATAEKTDNAKGAAGSASLQRSVFKGKRIGSQKTMVPKLRNKFASPTDTLLSPISKKLNNHKTKFLLAKSNPTKLSFRELAKFNNDDLLGDYSSNC